MSKTTASAAGGAMPGSGHAADHPDAALFAMAEECIVAARELKKVLDQLEAAEDKHRRIPTPETVLKTERVEKGYWDRGGALRDRRCERRLPSRRGQVRGDRRRPGQDAGCDDRGSFGEDASVSQPVSG